MSITRSLLQVLILPVLRDVCDVMLGPISQYSLSSQAQFRSKEISKSSVVDDMVAANPILFKTAAELTRETGEVHKKGEHPDHIVVIKHVPAVGDSSTYRSYLLVWQMWRIWCRGWS